MAPALVSPLCATLIMMTCADARTAFSLEHLSAWPARKGKFEECVLFKQFEEDRDKWIFEDIKKGVTEGKDQRLQRLTEIYPKIRSAESKNEATIINSILEQSSQEETLIFLLEDPQRCAVLKAWFPKMGGPPSNCSPAP